MKKLEKCIVAKELILLDGIKLKYDKLAFKSNGMVNLYMQGKLVTVINQDKLPHDSLVKLNTIHLNNKEYQF